MLRSACRSASSSMIWAWTVTSRAVVGSSAMSTSGSQREGHRDHHPLPHAAGELVRVVVDALRGRRDADEVAAPPNGCRRLPHRNIGT